MSIQDLNSIKQMLLEEHRKLEVPNPETYREGILAGLNLALIRIEHIIEQEDARMVREYEE